MSNTKREPLLSGDVIPIKLRSPEEINAMHESARAKDAELIQIAVDMAHSRAYEWTDKEFRDMLCDKELAFLAAAAAAGFKPSYP